MTRFLYTFLTVLVFQMSLFSQEDLLDELEEEVATIPTSTIEDAAFKALKIVNFESTKVTNKGDLYFIVAHRFGSVQNAFEDLFGLDNAVTKLGFRYGFTDWLELGLARSSRQANYGLHAKYKLVSQKKDGFPLNIVGFNLLTINTLLDSNALPGLEFNNRLNYTSQLLISHKFNKNFSFQLAPSIVHQNLVEVDEQDNTQFILGSGARLKISKRVSINADYGWHLIRADNSPFSHSLSIGFDIETGGHVFQLHFTNAQPLLDDGFLVEGNGDWGDGVFFFGFNLNRVF